MTDTQDNPIWQHHIQNLKNGTSVQNEDGSVSTVRTVIMGDGEFEYLIPTVWDGAILSDEEAWKRAMESGINWPKAPAGEEGVKALETLDGIIHKGMGSDDYVDEQMRGLQGFSEGALVEGPWTPERADESGRVDKPKENKFGDTIASMSARSFRDAWDAAVNAGKIDVNADDPRILTAFKQSNQYITDMATAGALTLQGATEAAAGAIGEVFGGGTNNEEMLATDIMGMFESAEGLGPASMVGKTENAVETTTEALKDIKLRANQPSALETTTLGSNLGNVGKGSSIPFFKKKTAPTGLPDANFGKKALKEVFEEDQWDRFTQDPDSPLSLVPDGETWDLPDDGYDIDTLGYSRAIPVDSMARVKNGEMSLAEVADYHGEDPTPEVMGYLNKRLTALSENPEFIDYVEKRKANPTFDPWSASAEDKRVIFESPIPTALESMAWPKKGKEGYKIISELKSNPSVRKAELDTVLDEIDPKARYSLEEIQGKIKGSLWDTEVKVFSDNPKNTSNYKDPQYQSYQRQDDLLDPEKEYFEVVIESNRRDKPGFEAKGQHFAPSTLAHARASVREDARGEYILGEEFQTDLLQHGYSDPVATIRAVTPKAAVEKNKDILLKEGIVEDENDLDILQILGEDSSWFFSHGSYEKFIQKVGAENLVPGATPDEVLWGLNPSGKTLASEDLLGLYSNYKAGTGLGNHKPQSDEAWDYYERLKDAYYDVVRKDVSDMEVPGISSPPIKKIEESVKMTIGALISEASKRGISRIVVPPLERIAAKRFPPGSEGYKKALDPKSGFYKTYVKSLQSSVKELEDEFGRGAVSSRPVDLNYKTTGLSHVEEALTRRLGYSPDNGWGGYFDTDFKEDVRAYADTEYSGDNLPSGLSHGDMSVIYRQLKQEGLMQDDVDAFAKTEDTPFSKYVRDLKGEDLVVTGTEIDFKGLLDSDHDLTKLKFAEGGMVEDEQMNKIMQEGGMADDGMTHEPATGNEIPPGSLASEVRDDIDVKLSEGEYVVPADVLRYYGVRFFEDLRAQAKQGMAKMASDGRIGGTAVTEEGVPTENVEEALTPEEEQMLMEALGAGSTGMAEGGTVFDRTKFSSSNYNQPSLPVVENGGLTTRKYINPQTKEVRELNFVNNMPVGAIPDGFVPWTKELADMPAETPKSPVSVPSITQNNRPEGAGAKSPSTPSTTAGAGDKETGGGTYAGWAKENYEAISKDPFGFGVNAINSIDDPAKGFVGKTLDRFGINPFEDARTLKGITDAQAALSKVTDPQQKKELQALIDQASQNLNSPIVGMTVDAGLAGTGKGKVKALQWFEDLINPKPNGATPAVTATTTPATSGLGTSSTSRGVSYISDANSKGEFSQRVATGSTAPTTSPRPQSRPASLAGGVKSGSAGGSSRGSTGSSGGSSSAGSRTESRRAKGGLVAKEQPKTKKSDKGLASKTKS